MYIDNNSTQLTPNQNNFQPPNKKKRRIENIIVFIVFVVAVVIASSFFYYMYQKEVKKIDTDTHLLSFEVSGYQFKEPFSLENHEYNVNVSENQAQISCQMDKEVKIEGCNEVVDLKAKNNLTHRIVLSDNGKAVVYTINIIKDNSLISSSDVKITSIEGNPLEATNKNATIKVNASSANGIAKNGYSFDGGKTWQSSNTKTVTDNQSLQIVVKDTKGNVTPIRNVDVNKIDKEKPTFQLNITKATQDRVTIGVSAIDGTSNNVEVSFNGGKYSTKKTYEVTKPGVYYATVRDAVGNVSDKKSITIKESDFAKKNNEVIKTFTATFIGNGAKVEKNYVSCTTKGDSCKITAPAIIRSDAVVVGWGSKENPLTLKYKVGDTITLKSNSNVFISITYKLATANFVANGADSIGSTSLSCHIYNSSSSCNVTAPTIKRSNGQAIGWSTNSQATYANVAVGGQLSIANNSSIYYAITKKTLTASFNSTNLSWLAYSTKSCTVYNTNNSCTIVMPEYNRPGNFNAGWNTMANSGPVYLVDTNYTLNQNTTFYPSYEHPYYQYGTRCSSCDKTKNSIYYDRRNISMQTVKKIGSVYFEYQSGIPQFAVNNHINFLNKLYTQMPFLFNFPGKVFVLTYDTYDKISMAYGLTTYTGVYFFIDIKYDDRGVGVKNAIDENATIHELAHAWDGRYNYKTGKLIRDQSDFVNFYNNLKYQNAITDNLAIGEVFAGMTSNYYWLNYANRPDYAKFALKRLMTDSEKATLNKIINKYICVSKNNYNVNAGCI